jgi:tetratricopeptide (TPR) repeat protein
MERKKTGAIHRKERQGQATTQQARDATSAITALTCYNKALKLTPQDADLWYELGQCQLSIAKVVIVGYGILPDGFNEAIASFEKALEFKPDHSAAIRDLAITWREKGLAIYDRAKITASSRGEKVGASECMNKSIKVNPQDKLAWFSKAVIADDLEKGQTGLEVYKRHDEALESYENFLRITKETVLDVKVGDIILMEDAMDIKSGVMQERIAHAEKRLQELKPKSNSS